MDRAEAISVLKIDMDETFKPVFLPKNECTYKESKIINYGCF